MPNILKCKIENTHSLQLTVPSPGVVEGQMDMVEDTVYAWLEDYATGELGIKIIEAERIVLPAASAATFAIGDYVYYDNTNKNVDVTAQGRYRCGVARSVKAALALTVEVDFWGHDAVAV